MIKRKTEKINKSILFAGCSFTWGQGLYYYTGLPSIVEQPWNTYDHRLVNHTQIEHAARMRFPRLVANYFNTSEIVDRVNGGSHQSILKWWNTCFFSDTNFVDGHGRTDIPLEDIGLVVMQLTQPHRDCIAFEGPGIAFNELYNDIPKLKRFMKIHDIKTPDDYVKWYIDYSLRPIEHFLRTCEDKGIPTLLLSWPNENLEWIRNNPWMNERLMTLTYKGIEYQSMADMMDENQPGNQELTIRSDYDYFNQPPLDDHPSMLCHYVMAENIIKTIEERNLLQPFTNIPVFSPLLHVNIKQGIYQNEL